MNRILKIKKPAYYLLSCTWGAAATGAGLLIGAVMLLTGHKPKRWGYSFYFEAGKKNWGGASWGFVFVKDRSFADERLLNHEFGHSLQNCVFGLFMLPLVALPSTTRYWLRRAAQKHGHTPKSAYDDIWFEGQATRLGTEKIKMLRSQSLE